MVRSEHRRHFPFSLECEVAFAGLQRMIAREKGRESEMKMELKMEMETNMKMESLMVFCSRDLHIGYGGF